MAEEPAAVGGKTAWPGRLLRRGSRGSEVKWVQERLRAAGFDPNGVDGEFGPRTADALTRYQASRKLGADGIVGPKTWAQLALLPDPPRQQTSRARPEPQTRPARQTRQPRPAKTTTATGDPDVRRIQAALRDAGFDPGRIDGLTGPATETAIRRFQLVHGLRASGRMDAGSRHALLEQRLRLSPTVAGVAASVPEPAPAADLVVRMLGRHEEYGQGTARSVHVSSDLAMLHEVFEWLRRVRALFLVEIAPELDGRLVVTGLALLDTRLAATLASNGFLDRLLTELGEPLDALLTPQAQERWKGLNLARTTTKDLNRLSPSSATALAYADVLRAASGQSRVHMEHLLAGLNQKQGGPFRRLLDGAGIGQEGFTAALAEAGKKVPSATAAPPTLVALPTLSTHAGEAVDNAFRIADTVGSPTVRSRHLLHGALSVPGCKLVDALARRGVRADDMAVSTEPAEPPSAPARPTMLAAPAADTVPEPGDGRVRQADRLDTAAEVEVFASVLLARDTPLPLAVGLFGDWGSGKSFFMAQLQERMEELAALARAGRPEAEPYCGKLRSIRFNAWHYVDANLWASLAATLFDEWAHADAPDAAEEKLGELTAAQDEARAARSARETLEQEVKQLEEAVERPGVSGTSAAAAIRAVRDEPDLLSKLDAARAGPTDDQATESLIATVGAVDGLAAKVRTFWQLLREEVPRRRLWGTAVAVAVVLAAAGVVWSATAWPVVGKVVTTVAAAVTTVATALGSALNRAIRTLQIAQEARSERERPLREKRLAVEHAREAEEVAEHKVAERVAELANLRDMGARLRQYVRTRATSSDYREQLGVISMVRRDFEHLVQLRQVTGPQQVVAAAEEVTAVPDIERIVLFIDDLDRCPHDKVIDVLQAVHLLLAFNLFVVVVGVDSRWLERSLQAHYSNLLEEPESYLEKIFQIPFTLRRMASPHYRNLIDELTPAARTGPGRPPPDRAPAGAAPPERTGDDTAASDDEELPGDRVSGGRTPPTVAVAEPPALPRPEALVISTAERQVLHELGDIVRTPRAAKRLVNIYRMLRVSVPDGELAAFESGGKECQAVVLLLGILLRRPPVAETVFAQIMAASDDADIWQILAGFPDLHDQLSPLRGVVTLDRAGPYRRWVPRVARFSLRLMRDPPIYPSPTQGG